MKISLASGWKTVTGALIACLAYLMRPDVLAVLPEKWSQVIMALGTLLTVVGIRHAMSTQLGALPSSLSARDPEKGSARPYVLVFVAVSAATFAVVACCLLATACGPISRGSVSGGIVDCTTKAARDHQGQFEPAVAELISEATGADGSVDWAQVQHGVVGFTVDDGMCVVADLVGRYLNEPPKLAPGEVMPTEKSLLEGFAQIRDSHHAGNLTYHTAHGDL